MLLWASLKVKENKKPKMFSFLVGLLFSLLLSLLVNYVLTPIIEKQLVKRFPEMGYIPEILSRDYSNTVFGVSFEQSMKLNDEGSWDQQEKQLTVSMMGDRSFSKEDFKDIGIKTCDALEENNDEYDYVNVHHVNSGGFLFFSYNLTYGGGASCEEWREKSVNDLFIMLPNDVKDTFLDAFN